MRFHQGDDEAPVQEAPVIGGSGDSWSDITEKTGKQWSCPSPPRCYCSNCGNLRLVAPPRGGAEGGVHSGNG